MPSSSARWIRDLDLVSETGAAAGAGSGEVFCLMAS
jgi:hypothetical protein